MSSNHDLRSWPEYFAPILSGEKSFDLRKHDRKFEVGDRIRFQEYEPDTNTYSGRECWRDIVYIFEGIGHQGAIEPLKGLVRGYCILGLK